MSTAKSFVLLAVLDVLVSIYGALVLLALWGWFIHPLGLPALNLGTALGLMCVVSLLSNQYSYRGPEHEYRKYVVNQAIYQVYLPTYLLVFGFIVHLFP